MSNVTKGGQRVYAACDPMVPVKVIQPMDQESLHLTRTYHQHPLLATL
jgi:hypothetical protein